MIRKTSNNLRLHLLKPLKCVLILGILAVMIPAQAAAQTNSLTIRTYLPPPEEAFDRIKLLPTTPIGGTCKTGEFYMNTSFQVQFCDGAAWIPLSSAWKKNGDLITLNNTDLWDQRVGIGTNSPQLKLSLENDGGILAKDTHTVGDAFYSDLPSLNTQPVLFWSPKQATFRAGRVDGAQWNNVNIPLYSTVFGLNNATYGASTSFDAILGGASNAITGADYSAIVGGQNNKLNNSAGFNQTILGGEANEIRAFDCRGCLIGGGQTNIIEGYLYSAIGGGHGNLLDRGTGYNAIIGGTDNKIELSESSLIGGGQGNALISESPYQNGSGIGYWPAQAPDYSTIIGGGGDGSSLTINGITTDGNTLGASQYSFIGGGSNNQIHGLYYNTIYGGQNNHIMFFNSSKALYKDIYGSTIGGGQSNTILSTYCLIGGGENNEAGFGPSSHDQNSYATVIGGSNNHATGHHAFIGGGRNNTASGNYSSIAGGNGNRASGDYSFVGGGLSNTASGHYSAVLGGESNTASGVHSFAGGRNMTASGDNTFIWGHSDTELIAADPNTFIIATGNVGIGPFTAAPLAKLHVDGNVRIESTNSADPNYPFSLILTNIESVSNPSPLSISTPGGTVGYDLAEIFTTDAEVSAGDVLVMDQAAPGQLKKSAVAYDVHVVGVASNGPAIIFRGEQMELTPDTISFEKGTTPPVALKGRVAVKVCLENGPIMPGDALTTSSVPGHAMKASDKDNSGTILGKALQPFNANTNGNQTGTISAFVSLY